MKQINFFAELNRLARLSKMGDPLERVSACIDFEAFRQRIEDAVRNKGKDPRKGGRPPFDAILMWKIVLLQEWYGISNDSVEYLINDRLSFQRFLGLDLNDKVPDANTLWDFKEALADSGADKALFEDFVRMLDEIGIVTRKGSIVDATFVDAPRQRNSREENEIIKKGGIPEGWEEPDNINKLRQKDTDARWTKKKQRDALRI